MQKSKLALLIPAALAVFLSSEIGAAVRKAKKPSGGRNFESSALSKIEVAPIQKKATSKKEFQKSDTAPTGMLNLDENEIVSTLKGINLLVAKTRDPRELPTLLLNRAMASFSLARKRLVDSKLLKMDEKSVRLMNIALADCQKVLESQRVSQEMLARAHYIRGLIFVYQDKANAASEEFKKSLQIDPASENSAWMGLHIAEDLFEKGEYKKASLYYRKYLKKLTPQAFDLARYKLAWCMINLNDFEEAQRIFLALIYSSSRDGYARDSLRDLAFILSTRSSESEILDLANTKLKRDEDRVEFLAAVMNQLETQNAVKLQSRVLSRLLELETDPGKKLQYLLAGMRTSRREYASVEHFNSFVKIRDFMKKEDLSSKEIESVKISLEQEAQYLIKSFLDTFSGKVKTPEALPKAKVGQGLKSLFSFYEKYFKQSKVLPELTVIWENVCYEISDWKCVDEVADKILQSPKLKAEHRRVSIDQLLALEQIYKGSTDALESRVEDKFRTYLTTYPQSEQWQNIANRLVALYLQAKESDKALGILDNIFEHERTGATLFDLMRTRFDLKKYAEILADTRVPSRKEDPRVSDIKREAALRLAIEARNKEDDENYRSYLSQFLRLNPPPDKLALVRKDLLDFLMSKNDFQMAHQELLRIPVTARCVGALKAPCLAVWRAMMTSGKFEEARTLFSGMSKKISAPFALQMLLSDLASNGKDRSGSFELLDLPSQEYILGVMSLLEPQMALGWLKSKSVKLNAAKSFPYKLIALRLKNGEWDLIRDRESEALLGNRYSFVSKKGSKPVKSDALLSSIVIPKGKVSEKRLGPVSAQIGQAVVQMRSRLQKDLAAKIPLEDKSRILEKAVQVESDVAAFIKRQDVPSAIPEDQVAQYLEKVNELAAGYEQQSKEWEKVLAEIRSAIEKSESEKASQALVLSSSAEYPFGEAFQDKKRRFMKDLIMGGGELAALIVWDLIRSEEKMSEEEYYKVRTGILFSADSSSVMRRYLYQELKQASQNDLLNELQGLGKQTPTRQKLASKQKAIERTGEASEKSQIENGDDPDLLEGELQNE